MASIPLLCNICTNEPEFSDISHLLTHVASKGHLSQKNKAQIRSHQDLAIRSKLVIYDRWYERYQIERLLSERMIAKESKEIGNRNTSSRSKPVATRSARTNKIRKKRPTVNTKTQLLSPSPIKIEGNIDPQLSHAGQGSPFIERESPSSVLNHVLSPSNAHFQGASRKAHIPCMSGWRNPRTPPDVDQQSHIIKAAEQSKPRSDGHRQISETSSDYFRTFIRSPSRSAYPDSSDAARIRVAVSPMLGPIRLSTANRFTDWEKAEAIQSPILKGVKWPGMSLFDSASFEAQRRRNQKKDACILETLEQNSEAIEQIEWIYWADGSLKKKRIITGNVDSSPVRESTPPSPPPKRHRMKAKKFVLKDLNTNVPKRARTHRARKESASDNVGRSFYPLEESEQMVSTPSPPGFRRLRTEHKGYRRATSQNNELQPFHERVQSIGSREFRVFKDDDYDVKLASAMDDQSSRHNRHGHEDLQDHNISSLPLSQQALNRLPWNAHFRAFAGNSRQISPDDQENIEPLFDTLGRIDDNPRLISNERVTQRYFSVSGHQAPQFFASMPPQMDFGGLTGPAYHGSTLNPLNASLQHGQHPYHHPKDVSRLTRPDFKRLRSQIDMVGQSASLSLRRSRD